MANIHVLFSLTSGFTLSEPDSYSGAPQMRRALQGWTEHELRPDSYSPVP
jgi:hypothetical protein